MTHNENDRVYVIGEQGLSRMDFNYQWEHKEARKRGLRNPWNHRPDKPIRYEEVIHKLSGTDFEIAGKRPIYNDYSEEELSNWKLERDEYMRQRDEWITLQMFHKYGYEAFLAECGIHSSVSKDFWKTVFPCESKGEAQCTMFCPIYDSCERR